MTTKDDILDAVTKRACGYAAREVVEEYALVDGSLELVKRKITTKDVPPDMTAAKMALDNTDAPIFPTTCSKPKKSGCLKCSWTGGAARRKNRRSAAALCTIV